MTQATMEQTERATGRWFLKTERGMEGFESFDAALAAVGTLAEQGATGEWKILKSTSDGLYSYKQGRFSPPNETAPSAPDKDSAKGLNGQAETVYCPTHGLVKSAWGHCEECLDEGYQDYDATRIAKSLIPSWTGLNVNGRRVLLVPVRDALGAVEAIGRYKHSDAIVLILWDSLVTALDHGRIGPHWVLNRVGG